MVFVYILTDSAHLARKLDRKQRSELDSLKNSEYFQLNKLFMKVNIVNEFADVFPFFLFVFFCPMFVRI